MDILALVAMLPPTILAAAAWRSSRNNSPNGAFEDIKKMVWWQSEEISQIKWFLVEHQETHIDRHLSSK